MTRKSPEPYDISVGKRVKFLRLQAGMSQEKVGEALGMTFQQVQKYEKGTNRIAPSRLNVLSKIFKVPMAAFFSEEKTNGSLEQDFAILLGTRHRQQIFQRLTALNDIKLETAILNLIDVATGHVKKKKVG